MSRMDVIVPRKERCCEAILYPQSDERSHASGTKAEEILSMGVRR